MHENDADGEHEEGPADPESGGPFGSSRGAPERPLLEAFVILAALYFSAYLPSDSSAIGGMLSRPTFYIFSMACTLPGALLVLYMMATTDGLAAFGVGRPRKASFARGALLAVGSFAMISVLGFALDLAGIRNPIWAEKGSASVALVPLILVSSTATGYCEELCFRAYLLRRLGQARIPTAWAIAASTAVFAGAHGAQGIAGFVTAAILGLAFALVFDRDRNLHEIAIGHAAYNAIVFIVELYS